MFRIRSGINGAETQGLQRWLRHVACTSLAIPFVAGLCGVAFSIGDVSAQSAAERAPAVVEAGAAAQQLRATEAQNGSEPSPFASLLARMKQGEDTRIVCFGDSVTGLYYHTGGVRAYTDMLGLALQQVEPHAKLTMINAGVSGHTTADGLKRMEKDVLSHSPQLVTVMFGLNDVTRVPIEDYRENLKTIVNRCRAVGAEVLLCTPNNVIDTPPRPIAKLEQYCDVLRDVGRELQVPVADTYREMETLRKADRDAWRLLLSDEIHPNMEGHKRMAEILARAITGLGTSLDKVPTTPNSWKRIREAVQAGRTVKVLAMPPFDESLTPVLAGRFPTGQFEMTTWDVTGLKLPDIEKQAQEKVRALRPDLVVIAIPRASHIGDTEREIHAISWTMNWSLSFGQKEWECLMIHPAVWDQSPVDEGFDTLIRKLVRAQDLTGIDRMPGDERTVTEILEQAFQDAP